MNTVITGRNMVHIDRDTGEKICETSGITQIRDSQKTDKQIKNDEYKNTHDMYFGRDMGFVKLFTTTTLKLAQKLTPKEFTIAVSLCKFVDYENCALRNGYGNGIHDMDLHEIAKELNVDYSNLSRTFKKLILKGIIGEFRVGSVGKQLTKRYYVNPYIYINGKNPNKEVVSNFDKSGWKEFINS